MPQDVSDTVTTNDKKNLQTAHAALVKLLGEVKKAGGDDKAVKAAEGQVDEVGRSVEKIAVSRSPRAELAPIQKRLVALQKSLKQLGQQAKSGAKGWTVTVHKDVTAFAKKASDPALDRTVAAIGKIGLSASGLRNIKGKVYDVHSGSSSDNRYVGEADPAKQTFEFLAVYKHAKGGGKQHVAGKAIPGY